MHVMFEKVEIKSGNSSQLTVFHCFRMFFVESVFNVSRTLPILKVVHHTSTSCRGSSGAGYVTHSPKLLSFTHYLPYKKDAALATEIHRLTKWRTHISHPTLTGDSISHRSIVPPHSPLPHGCEFPLVNCPAEGRAALSRSTHTWP